MSYEIMSQADVELWSQALPALSLDRTAAFWESMGLGLQGEEVNTVLRYAREFVKKIMIDGDAKVEERPGILAKMFESIARDSGDPTAQKLHRWGSAYLSDSMAGLRPARIWNTLLARLVELSARTYPVAPLRLPVHRKKSLVAAITPLYRDMQRRHRELDQLEMSPPSTWEGRVRETYDPQTTPFDLVADAIGWNTFTRVLYEIRKLLNDGEMKMLFLWGRDQAAIMDIPRQLVDDLSKLSPGPEAHMP